MKPLLAVLQSFVLVVATGAFFVSCKPNSNVAGLLNAMSTAKVPGTGAAKHQKILYQYVDDHGKVVFVPSLAKVPPSKRKDAGYIILNEDDDQSPPLAHARTNLDVTLYMTSWCGYCHRMSQDLDALGVQYVAKDIEKDNAAVAEFRRLGGGGVPVVVINGEVVHGYNSDEVKRLVTKYRQK